MLGIVHGARQIDGSGRTSTSARCPRNGLQNVQCSAAKRVADVPFRRRSYRPGLGGASIAQIGTSASDSPLENARPTHADAAKRSGLPGYGWPRGPFGHATGAPPSRRWRAPADGLLRGAFWDTVRCASSAQGSMLDSVAAMTLVGPWRLSMALCARRFDRRQREGRWTDSGCTATARRGWLWSDAGSPWSSCRCST